MLASTRGYHACHADQYSRAPCSVNRIFSRLLGVHVRPLHPRPSVGSLQLLTWAVCYNHGLRVPTAGYFTSKCLVSLGSPTLGLSRLNVDKTSVIHWHNMHAGTRGTDRVSLSQAGRAVHATLSAKKLMLFCLSLY